MVDRFGRTGGAAGLLAAVASIALMAGCSASSSRESGSSAPAPGRGPAQGGAPVPQAGPGTTTYETPPARTAVSSEVDPSEQPLSTFAMDVDTASYGFARRTLRDGRRPDPGTIRPEEFINSFRQNYREPTGNGFTVQVDGARLPESHTVQTGPGETRIMRVGLQTRRDNTETRPDVRLTLVVDVSGSMGEPGRLDLVKDGLRALIGQLRPADAVAVVAYSDTARTLRKMTPVRDRRALLDAIDELHVEGSTNLEAGLIRGYQVAREGFGSGAANRVVLLSDGLANVGSTSAEPILRRVREAAAKQISLLGVGVGSDYGDALMEQLADRGDGFVVYVSEREQASRIFAARLPGTLAVRALDAKVQVTFDPTTVRTYRLIGYDNRALPPSAFRDDRTDGGEVGPGHSVTALYAVRLRDGGAGRVAEARIRWQDPATRVASEVAATVSVDDLTRDFARASSRLKVCYSAAYFAEALRGSRYATEARLNELAVIADGVGRAEEDADVADLAALIRRAERL